MCVCVRVCVCVCACVCVCVRACVSMDNNILIRERKIWQATFGEAITSLKSNIKMHCVALDKAYHDMLRLKLCNVLNL